MRIRILLIFFLLACVINTNHLYGQGTPEQNFLNPPASAKPWVFWYWMHAAVSKEGITADLEAMKEVGIGGAYLMPIKDTLHKISFQPTVRQLTPEWWAMVKFAMQEAKRLGLQLGMHVSDGFALAGGRWITPELSMQKLVWSKMYIRDGENVEINLAQPEANENYYKDVAVFAYPANSDNAFSEVVMIPSVSTSNGVRASFLSFAHEGTESFKSDSSCWIQYKYPKPFSCRSIKIHTGGNNYQAQRLIVQTSMNGIDFKTITRLDPPRHGWQDADEDVTYSLPLTTAKFFRFVYDKDGSEPGAEDLDAAKWKPSLKVMGIYLSDEPVIHQYESKNGSVWRISKNTTTEQVPDQSAIPVDSIINITTKMSENGNLLWTPPPGNWVIVRIGHTSNGHTNYTGGAALGLECDKFNAAAVKLQFNSWFAKAFTETDTALAKDVLKLFHVDSWECGSQNWSSNFPAEFKKRRGYDLMPYLLTMAGIPVQSAATSEKVLHDVRETIAELVNDIFYTTLKNEAHAKGCSMSAEAIAPTMMSDGLLHYKNTDIPMGEFWLNSPTHDKPNDMRDAISGAHIYGKKIIQAESFTTVRMDWGEHPGSLKKLGDRNFALGINKMVFHVFAHNPWMDKKPGMTLDGVGLYFQRDQTWFKQSKAWIEYLTRCQAVLQMGEPVVEIAVFTGEEMPRRSILPDLLVTTLPGIFGKEKVEAEKQRLQNKGEPQREIPDGVTHSANMADLEDWIDPLNGYTYDSFNPDALMMMQVKNGRVVLPGGASYAVLVFPDQHQMNPNNHLMSLQVAKKILQLLKDGAKIIMSKDYVSGIGLKDSDNEVKLIIKEMLKPGKKGKIMLTPYVDTDFKKLGIEKDVKISQTDNSTPFKPNSIAWTHRKAGDADIYFISNQSNEMQGFNVKFRVKGKNLEIWDPVTGKIGYMDFGVSDGSYFMGMGPGDSYFYVFRNSSSSKKENKSFNSNEWSANDLSSKPWRIQFDKKYGGPEKVVEMNELKSWTLFSDSSVKYYSGTAVYSNTFEWNEDSNQKTASIQLDSVYNIATVKVNGIDCGTLWIQPYYLDITKALKKGTNTIEIEVTNTWHNRLIGDNLLPENKRTTFTTAPFRLSGKPLLPAGIVGKVKLIVR
ncbi:MAG: glycosyl hydrolase [Lacibacter sp.]